MDILLWILQIALAAHTVMGAMWKFSHSEKSVPSLKKTPHLLWLAMILPELLCSVGLLISALDENLKVLVPIAAIGIGLEMLFFCVMHLFSGIKKHGSVYYWLVVAAICGFIAYGRLVLVPA